MKNKLTLIFLLGFLYIVCGNIYAQKLPPTDQPPGNIAPNSGTPPGPPTDQPPGAISPDGPIEHPGDQPPGEIPDDVDSSFIMNLQNFVRLGGVPSGTLSEDISEVLSGVPGELLSEILSEVLSRVPDEVFDEVLNEVLSGALSGVPDEVLSEVLNRVPVEVFDEVISEVLSRMSNENTYLPTVVPPSPQAAALTQYVDYPVSHYTGVPNISIPLYEINCDGVTVPLTLSYHASGIQVSQEASWVGLGWNLSTGGAISRSVKCTDDFFYESVFPIESGFYTGPEIAGLNYTPQKFGNDRELHGIHENDYYTMNGTSCGAPGLKTDSEPDIFFLSLPNLSNKFIIDKSRGAVLFDKNKNVKIEILGTATPSYGNYYYFVVTTMDGAKYYFDQHEETTTYSSSEPPFNKNFTASNKLDEDGSGNRNKYISAWYLSKIITPSQQEIKFTYAMETITSPLQENCTRYTQFGYYNSSYGGNVNNWSGWGVQYSKSKSKQNTFRLTKIEWDGGSVEFVPSYNNRYDLNGNAKYLDKLIVRDKNNTFVKGFVFGYEYFNEDKLAQEYGHVYLRLKLNGVREYFDDIYNSPNNGYQFYYFEGTMPTKNSKNKDYWGYNNNSNYGANYYASVYDNGILLSGAVKNSDFDYLKIGTLKEIKLPTGGITKFVYEENTFDHSVKMPSPPKKGKDEYLHVFNKHIVTEFDNGSYPSSDSYTFTISSAHNVNLYYYAESYSKIKDLDFTYGGGTTPIGKLTKISGTPAFSTQYIYLPIDFHEAYDGVHWATTTYQLSAGTYTFEACTPPKDVFIDWTLRNTNDYEQYEYKGGGLRIAQVVTDGKIRNFKYTGGRLLIEPVLFYYYLPCAMAPGNIWFGRSPVSIAQLSESKLPSSTLSNGNSVGYDQVEEYVTDGNHTSRTVYTFYNNREEELVEEVPFAAPTYPNFYNGMPISIKHYADNTLVQENTFQYQSEYSSPVSAFIYSQNFCFAYGYTYQMEWIKKSKEITKTYTTDNQSQTQETNYTYNTNFLLSTSSITRSDGNVLTTKYTYPFDIKHGADMALMQKMTEKFMLAAFVEKVNYLNNGTVINGEYHKYKEFFPNIFLPERIDLLRLDIPTSYSTIYPNNTTTMYGYSKLMPEVHYKYNNKGNVLEEKSDGSQFATTYIWSYTHQYPIAEIKNATLDEVKTALGYSDSQLEDLAAQSNPDISWVDAQLRNYFNNKTALVTTYTYKPLVGVTSMTDPRGIVTYYEYDPFGRLEETYYYENNNFTQKRIIESYKYHYRN